MDTTNLDDPARFGFGQAGAWLALRALHTVTSGHTWAARYVAVADPSRGHHVLDIGTDAAPHYRLLYRDEVWWWALGYADGRGHGKAVADLLREPVPRMVSIPQAAAMLGMTVHGVGHHLRTRGLYSVYAQTDRVERYLLAVQVAADAAARAAKAAHRGGGPTVAYDNRARKTDAEWRALYALLPPPTRPADLDVDVTPAPSPSPLPVVAGARAPTPQIQALRIGARHRWFSDVQPGRDDGMAFTVRIPLPSGKTVRRELAVRARGRRERERATSGVLAWVLGVADAHRAGRLVAYRDGLG